MSSVKNITFYTEDDCLVKVVFEGDGEILYHEYDVDKSKESIILTPAEARDSKAFKNPNLRKTSSKTLNFYLKVYNDEYYIELENSWIKKSIKIPLSNVESLSDLSDNFDELKDSMPNHYFDFLKVLKEGKKRRVNYKCGDIFRVDLDVNHFVYGVIIGKFSDFREDRLIRDEHPLSFMMAVPVMTRLFDTVSDNPYLLYDDLVDIPLLSPTYVMDNSFISNTYSIVDHKELVESDIEFPMHCLATYKTSFDAKGTSLGINNYEHIRHLISLKQKVFITLSWGFGSITVSDDDLMKKEFPLDDFNLIGNIDIGFGYNISVLNDKPVYNYDNNFKYHSKRKEVFEYFNLDSDISFDDFNKNNNGMTKDEYLKYISLK